MKHHQVSKRDTYTYIYNYIVFVVATRRHMWKFLLHQTLAESPKMMTCFEAFLRGKVESLSLKMNPFHFPHKAPSTKHSTSGSRNTEADMMLDCSSEELFRLIDLWCCFELEKNEWKTHGHALWLRWPSTYPRVLFGDYCHALAVLSQLNAMSSGSPVVFATQFMVNLITFDVLPQT